MSWVAAGFATAAAVTGIVTMIDSNNKANDAFDRQKEIDADMRALEQARQDIPDPSRHIKDLSRKITNPYANLAVATGAAKMQAEETDLSLAATLDTLKATGASAGGATALAQAALRSKKGISASIEKQEAGNQRLRAQGEQAMIAARTQEQQRVQAARAAGEQWMFGKQETRELQTLNRMAAQQQQNQAQQMQYRAESAQAAGMTSQAIMGGVTAGIGAGQKKKPGDPVDPKTGAVSPGGGVYGPDQTSGWMDPNAPEYEQYMNMVNMMQGKSGGGSESSGAYAGPTTIPTTMDEILHPKSVTIDPVTGMKIDEDGNPIWE